MIVLAVGHCAIKVSVDPFTASVFKITLLNGSSRVMFSTNGWILSHKFIPAVQMAFAPG